MKSIISLIAILFLILSFAEKSFTQITFQKTFGGSGSDVGYSVQQTSDGGYVVSGMTAPLGFSIVDVYLIKTDSSGNTLWTKTFPGSDTFKRNSVQQTSDGGYAVVGSTFTLVTFSNDVYLIKTNANGDSLWAKTFGGSNDDFGMFIRQTSDSEFAIAGVTTSFGAGNNDALLLKTNSSGNIIFSITSTSGENGSISPSGIVNINYGSSQRFTFSPNIGYRVDSVLVDEIKKDSLVGYTFKNINSNHTISVKFKISSYSITAIAGSHGTVLPSGTVNVNYGSSQRFTFSPNTGYHIDSVIVDGMQTDSTIGYTFYDVTANHRIVVKFALSTGFAELSNNIPTVFSLHQNFPNPFNPTTEIKFDIPVDVFTTLKVYDVLGKEVATLVNGMETAGYKSVKFDATSLHSGLYFYKLTTPTFSQTRKLLLLK